MVRRHRVSPVFPYTTLFRSAGLMNVPLTNAAMAATPPSAAGVASALLNASREVAGLLGITVIGAVLRTAQGASARGGADPRSEEHTSELQSRQYLVCRPLLE